MDSIYLNDIRERVEKKSDFDILDEKIYLYGVCPNCKESKEH